ncbi:Plasma membrane calcium-transporting ATPase 4 [Tetrabaena socialis]|uniref:P-type Cu(+) transporter n=1 Tax=Tetrabaena socialis TaxID=47790 RepID=A0A2J7ZSP8_9CHLO|nr:Plasma membrane calcium-transporting ATPase 4 [Tetrabaena socialis]|eukprot:PNH03295.1 Plasma membrane calcium-transporting ATPase 4 [Tetrabaena socialis]
MAVHSADLEGGKGAVEDVEKRAEAEPLAPGEPCPYSVEPSSLFQINAVGSATLCTTRHRPTTQFSLTTRRFFPQDKDDDTLAKYGGATGLAKLLHADLHSGLNDSPGLEGVVAHRDAYGANEFPEKPPPSFLMMLFEAAKDPMIIILLVVALVTIVLGAAVPEQRAHNGWSEGVAVLGTALIVVFIGAGQDYSKERQFQRLNALKDVIEVKVSRNGKQVVVINTEIVVGDDNNFVRVLSACETMGGATAICSDKTGTLTENRMTVVEGWFAGSAESAVPQPEQLHPELLSLLKYNCALNSKAFLVEQENGTTDFVGNRTECALLIMLRKLGFEYKDLRKEREHDQVKLYGFSSARKMAGVLVREPSTGNLRLYNKGAAEWVLRRCESLMRPDGTTEPMDAAKLEEMIELVTGMAKRGLRCICLSYRDYPADDPSYPPEFFEDSDQVDNGLIAFAIVGIKDPVRAEVPDAVATCQRAGIIVRMVTGDNIHTAQHIARECGILTDDAIAMEGPAFRAMPAAELIPLLPRLRVLARSSPEDKLVLVSLLKKQGEVVAVTGDGTNDAPALKESDVGLAMGIAARPCIRLSALAAGTGAIFTSFVFMAHRGACPQGSNGRFNGRP